MIRLEHVSVIFKQKHHKEVIAVKDVSLHIQKGEIFGIVGTSGAGKSSLIRTLNGLQKPTSGQVYVDGEDITNTSGRKLRTIRKKMGMIFQHFNLISRKTVGQNIEFALKIQNYPKQDRETRVKELLGIVGLTEKEHVYPATLSGGQKQRVGIARALAANPKVLLCDEATSALDVQTTEEILELLKKINKELSITIVFITHQLEIAKVLFDRIVVMSEGFVVEENNSYEIFAMPSHEVTRALVKENIKLPDQVVENAKGEILTLVYKGEKSVEPIISLTNKKFDVILNILHGKIEYIQQKPIGILVITLEGSLEERERAKQFIAENIEEIIPYNKNKEGGTRMQYGLEMLLELGKASRETLQMVSIAAVLAVVVGLILGLILYITANKLLYKNKVINTIAGFIINVIRSIPFVILLVLLVPVTAKLVGTTIGPKAAAVPLTVASIAFFARLAEASFEEIDKGLIEAALAMGGGIRDIISGVLLVEALPGLVRAITVTLISIIGFSAMAGTVGGGGIGDLAIRFGYYRYQMDIMFVTVVLLVVVVQIIQISGEKIAKVLTKK